MGHQTSPHGCQGHGDGATVFRHRTTSVQRKVLQRSRQQDRPTYRSIRGDKDRESELRSFPIILQAYKGFRATSAAREAIRAHKDTQGTLYVIAHPLFLEGLIFAVQPHQVSYRAIVRTRPAFPPPQTCLFFTCVHAP